MFNTLTGSTALAWFAMSVSGMRTGNFVRGSAFRAEKHTAQPSAGVQVYSYLCAQAMPACCNEEWRTVMRRHGALRNISGLG